jgi:hypothetical protein
MRELARRIDDPAGFVLRGVGAGCFRAPSVRTGST